MPPIVILTPVRNEEWVIRTFLQACSEFADAIILLDQGSDDDTRLIASQFPKCRVFSNPSGGYNEAERQNLLISLARDLFPEGRVLIALDADEIPDSTSLAREKWDRLRRLSPGTILGFEKPDLFEGGAMCRRWQDCFWPLGYVDDGAVHHPSEIHSIRIPTPVGAPVADVEDIVILHFANLRPSWQKSKARFYSVQENLLKRSDIRHRRITYRAILEDWNQDKLEAAPEEWLRGYADYGIGLPRDNAPPFSWYDVSVVQTFAAKGCSRFWIEPIWDFSWEDCVNWACSNGALEVPIAIRRPPWIFRTVLQIMDSVQRCAARLRARLGRPGGSIKISAKTRLPLGS